MVRPNCRPCTSAAIARCARPTTAPNRTAARLQARSFVHQTARVCHGKEQMKHTAAAPPAAPLRPRRTSLSTPSSPSSLSLVLPLSTTYTRNYHATPSNASITERLGDMARQALKRTIEPYGVFGATRQMYQKCTQQAAYKIPDEARRNDDVPVTTDGEEIGVGGGVWHDDFNLIPSFSTWSQVTMLHMYLLVTRLRCFDKETYRMWQSMLVDNFFQEAEDKMDIVHHISSRGLRQRYLQDLFMVWRGVMVAYDEGLTRGDAVLAAAIWRNMFKAQPDVDVRHLAAIVAWMRRSISKLDRTPDEAFILHAGAGIFNWPPPTADLASVDEPASKELGVLLGEAERLEGSSSVTAAATENEKAGAA